MAQSNQKKFQNSSLEWPVLSEPFKPRLKTKFVPGLKDLSTLLKDPELRVRYLIGVVRMGALTQLAKQRLVELNFLSLRSVTSYIDFTKIDELVNYYGEGRIPLRYMGLPADQRALWTKVLNDLLTQLDQHITSCSLISRTLDHLEGA